MLPDEENLSLFERIKNSFQTTVKRKSSDGSNSTSSEIEDRRDSIKSSASLSISSVDLSNRRASSASTFGKWINNIRPFIWLNTCRQSWNFRPGVFEHLRPDAGAWPEGEVSPDPVSVSQRGQDGQEEQELQGAGGQLLRQTERATQNIDNKIPGSLQIMLHIKILRIYSTLLAPHFSFIVLWQIMQINHIFGNFLSMLYLFC